MCATQTRSTIPFIFAAPLTVHLQPQVQIVDVDKDATFQCMISGHPVNDVKWLHNGKILARNNRIEVIIIWRRN